LEDRGQTGLPANFRQKAPEIHGSLVSPRRPPCTLIVHGVSPFHLQRSLDEISNLPKADASNKEIDELIAKLKVFKEDEFAAGRHALLSWCTRFAAGFLSSLTE
jgi:hypothetical protein